MHCRVELADAVFPPNPLAAEQRNECASTPEENKEQLLAYDTGGALLDLFMSP